MTASDLFLTGDHRSHRRLRTATDEVVDAVCRWAYPTGAGPWSGVDPAVMAKGVTAIDPCPAEGVDLADVLDELGPVVLAHGVRPSDPWCAAHLQCPTLVASAAAEVAVAATNQSMDSFDQAPAATLVEDHLVSWLGGLLGLPPTSSGVLTSGGTASNLLALYLARERASPSVRLEGLSAAAAQLRIVTSEAAHFSVSQAVGVLGLGRRAVATVAVDRHGRIDLAALDHVLAGLAADGLVPMVLVGTAGTTDHGAIDPLAAMADRAASVGAWFHVDAAVGGALAVSDRLRPELAGVERADSVTVDFHKLWWQPIAASALVVADADTLGPARHPSDYLDRPDDDDDRPGPTNLVSRSLETSRRFDAFKILVGLRTTGRRRLAAMVEHVVDVAHQAADEVAARPDLELLAPPSTVTVLFRWCRGGDLDLVNTQIQRRLFESGRAVVGRTRVGGRVALKLTFVNPLVTIDDVRALLDEIHP